jgi:signal transduction histidine kinase/response regulator of citrate/malate metabolism
MTEPARGAPSEPPAPRGRLFRKYVVSFVAVVSVALIANSAIDAWFSFQEQKRLLIGIQHEQAGAAAAKISQFLSEIERQMGWLTQLPSGAVTRDDLRIDAIRLLRLTPAIAEVAQLDTNGREQLRVSRHAMDVIGSQADLSTSEAFRAAKANSVYYGPIYFFRETDPYMTLAIAGAGRDPAISIAEVNLRFVWDLVSQIKVGTTGSAYIVDRQGRLVAHPDLWPVLRNTDLARLSQVQRALTGGAAEPAGLVADDLNGLSVLSVHAAVPALGWLVFVELPTDEAYASIRASVARSALLLVGMLGCAILAALFFSRRMTIPIHALRRGAARIGSGDLEQRLAIRTGDELEALGEQFNQMAAQLQGSYATLEGKVTERTAELAQARDHALAEHAAAERARQGAEQANETKSRFLAVVSHELRTPLNAVIGVLQLLDDGRLDPSQRRHVATAAASGETLLALLDAILEYARLEAGTETLERRNFHLDRLIEAAADLMRPQAAAKGLALRVSLAGAAVPVNGDPVRINRVLLNLIGNAIKFTERGYVDVQAALEPTGAGRVLRLSISDTGIGVAPEMQERIFEDFVQADDSIMRRFGGTGLGLAISRRLARLMGGDLAIESTPGSGSTFRLTVPLAGAEEAAPPLAAAAPTQPLALLLVDDDPVNREIGAALLRLIGHTPTVAADGPSAIALAQAGRFDALLMDVHMPGMDGIEAASRIRSLAREPKPRIIALTADMSERSRERLAAGGIHTIVSKPILLDALRRALAGGEAAPPLLSRPDNGKAQALIDEAFFAGQQDLLGVSRLRILRQLFADTSAGLIRTLIASAQATDHGAMRRAAHQLGSSAGAFGLAALFTRCTWLEDNAASLPRDALVAAAAELDALTACSLAALDACLRPEPASAASLQP